jgi:16S rRNA G1207 methylase RsmC
MIQESTQAILGNKTFTLERFPLEQKTRSLQAWDSADEYLISYIEQHHSECANIAIINDSFGALACYFNDKAIATISDSFIAHQAVQHNLMANKLPADDLEILSCFELPKAKIDLVIIKIPKNNGLLAHQLAKLSQVLAPNTLVIGAAKTKDIHNSTSKTFEKYIGTTTTSLAVKKSRLVMAKFEHDAQETPPPIEWDIKDTHFNIKNHANVFSRDSLDIGARFFINFLPQTKKVKNIVDLGCGNGVIGLSTLTKCPSSNVTFVDESDMAVNSAGLNVQNNLPEKLNQCTFMQNDCMTGFEDESQDVILCNPPFHQQQAVTDHIAWQMFIDARRVLKVGGEIRIIGNRHLDYHGKLERIFGNCKLLGSNSRFVVLSSTKEKALKL